MKVTRNVLSQSGQKAKTRDPLVTGKLQEQDMAPHLLTWHRTLAKEVSALIALSSLTADSWQIWEVFTSFQEITITTLIQMWRTDVKNWLTGKDPDAGKDWRQEEKGTTEDEMVGWHHRLDGHEFEQALGVGDGQGSLACCGSWGRKE